MKTVDCTPSLEGYKAILKLLKEVEEPTEEQKKTIKDLETYLNKTK